MSTINPSWVELQTGLYLDEQVKTIGGIQRTFRYLHSADGYCFYDIEREVCDEEGNVIAPDDIQPNQRMYFQYAALAISMSSWTYEQLNAKYISVPVQEGFEIANVGNETETM